MRYNICMYLKTWHLFTLGAIALFAVQIGTLYLFGQPGICTCDFVKLWEGDINSAGMSQHLSDWYSFSHIIHGFLFYLALWLLFPRTKVWQRLLIAMGLEIGWEIAENTPMVIEAYREQALARGYVGDSIINSVMDTFMMVIGFVLAWRAPVWLIVVLALAMEIGVAYFIHDNLALNILGFFHQFDFITQWQEAVMR
ncbi:DUF2585 family protein [Candidatus Kaiserbacteria bacterium]|nr:DUF2585 family protein [Candidatus Kaiserbacteria bacterium]